FRMSVQIVNVLVNSADREGAAELLAALEDDRGPFGPPDPERAEELRRRVEMATFPRSMPPDLALARAEACCALARFWIADGRFGPAAMLVQQALASTSDETPWISRPDVAVLLAEIHLDCGDLRSC